MKAKPEDKYSLLGSAGEFWPKENEDVYCELVGDLASHYALVQDQLSDRIVQVKSYELENVGEVFHAHAQFYGYEHVIWDCIGDAVEEAKTAASDFADDIVWIKTCVDNIRIDGEARVDQEKASAMKMWEAYAQAWKARDVFEAEEYKIQAQKHEKQAQKYIVDYRASTQYTYTQAQDTWGLWENQIKTKLADIEATINRCYKRLAGEYTPE